ncbi:MAG: hypothetical protein WCB62_21375 [Pseudolabrys sp.]
MLTQISTHQNLSQQPSAENAIAADSGIAMLWLVFYLMALGLAVSSPLILSAIEFAGAAKISTEGSAQRQVLSDALRQNADVIRALGMTGRLSRHNCELILTQQLDQTRVRTTAQLEGLVSYVSADLNPDRQKSPNAGPYYTVRVTRPPSERRRLGGLELVSGMPVGVFLQTGSRTMMS